MICSTGNSWHVKIGQMVDIFVYFFFCFFFNILTDLLIYLAGTLCYASFSKISIASRMKPRYPSSTKKLSPINSPEIQFMRTSIVKSKMFLLNTRKKRNTDSTEAFLSLWRKNNCFEKDLRKYQGWQNVVKQSLIQKENAI